MIKLSNEVLEKIYKIKQGLLSEIGRIKIDRDRKIQKAVDEYEKEKIRQSLNK